MVETIVKRNEGEKRKMKSQGLVEVRKEKAKK